MTLTGWGCLLVAAIALVWLVREVLTARRSFRPVQVGVVFSAAIALAGSVAALLLTGPGPLGPFGIPRRYATYRPASGFNALVLIPAVGVRLLVGAIIGAIRTRTVTPVQALTAARTRNRLSAAAGTLLLLVGIAALVAERLP